MRFRCHNRFGRVVNFINNKYEEFGSKIVKAKWRGMSDLKVNSKCRDLAGITTVRAA